MDYSRNSRGPVQKRLSDSGVNERGMHEVALVGGSTRIPNVQALVQERGEHVQPRCLFALVLLAYVSAERVLARHWLDPR